MRSFQGVTVVDAGEFAVAGIRGGGGILTGMRCRPFESGGRSSVVLVPGGIVVIGIVSHALGGSSGGALNVIVEGDRGRAFGAAAAAFVRIAVDGGGGGWLAAAIACADVLGTCRM